MSENNEGVNNMIASSQAATFRNAVCGVGTPIEQSALVGGLVGVAQAVKLTESICDGALTKPADVSEKMKEDAMAAARAVVDKQASAWGAERDAILAAGGIDRDSIGDAELAGLLTFVGVTGLILDLAEMVGPIRERARQRIGVLLAAVNN